MYLSICLTVCLNHSVYLYIISPGWLFIVEGMLRGPPCVICDCVSSDSQEGGVKTVGISMCVWWEHNSPLSMCLLGTMAMSPVWPIIGRVGGTVYSLPSWEQKYCSMWHRGHFYRQLLFDISVSEIAMSMLTFVLSDMKLKPLYSQSLLLEQTGKNVWEGPN